MKNTNNSLNQISFVLLLVALIFLANCLVSHWCMCGHGAHIPRSDRLIAMINDRSVIFLVSCSLFLSLKDPKYKLSYYLTTLLIFIMMFLLNFLGILLMPILLKLHANNHSIVLFKRKKKEMKN